MQVPPADSQAAFEMAASLVVDADRPDAAAKDAQSASILTAVYMQANDTLAAIRQTAAALDAVERAAAAVERAKDRHDDTVSQGLCHTWSLTVVTMIVMGAISSISAMCVWHNHALVVLDHGCDKCSILSPLTVSCKSL